MASSYNKLTKSVLVQLTEAELETLQERANREGTTTRNIIRRALKSFFGDTIPDDLFTDREKGNWTPKNDPQEVVSQLGV